MHTLTITTDGTATTYTAGELRDMLADAYSNARGDAPAVRGELTVRDASGDLVDTVDLSTMTEPELCRAWPDCVADACHVVYDVTSGDGYDGLCPAGADSEYRDN